MIYKNSDHCLSTQSRSSWACTYPVCDEYTFCSHLFPEKAMCLVFITTTWSPQSPAKTSKRFYFRLLIKKMVKQGGKHTWYNNNSKKGAVVLDIESFREETKNSPLLPSCGCFMQQQPQVQDGLGSRIMRETCMWIKSLSINLKRFLWL